VRHWMEAKLKIELEGETHEIECQENETILEAALREGIDAPYSCMAGVCISCQAHIKDGEVDMESADALTEEQIEAGEILTCQAIPKSAEITISYSETDK